MTFLDPWNPTYEGVPADSELINLGANRIRDLKINIRERANTDLSWGDTLDNGRHNQSSYNVQTGDPPAVTGVGFVYTKAVGAVNELFWKDNAGHVFQLTSNGLINYQAFPSGTTMAFLQATPPTGWTQLSTWNDAVVRLVGDASGGSAGGGWVITGASVVTTVNTTVNTSTSTSVTDGGSTASTSVQGHSLTYPELAPHRHLINAEIAAANLYGGGTLNAYAPAASQFFAETDSGEGLTGAAHVHPAVTSLSLALNASSSSSSSATSPASSTFSNDGNWRPHYVNGCVGRKT